MNVSELSGRVKIFSLVKDEDGSISRVPMCLCELCRVNHFLCPRYASHSSAAGSGAVLELCKDLAQVRLAQGIGGLSFEAMLSYLSKTPTDLLKEIDGVCKNSGMSLEQLKEHAKRVIELRQQQRERDR